MRKSIKTMVGIRVIAALASVLLFSVMITINIIRIDRTQERSIQASAVLDRALTAEVAHYKWASNLSNALYAGTEFTGSMDHTSCALGKWLYSDLELENAEINRLRAEIEPLHKELHASAGTVLEMYGNSHSRAQQYYQETIQTNLSTLVGLLDQVVDRGEVLSTECSNSMRSTITIMHITTTACLVLNLVALVSLVVYVLRSVIKPLLYITRQVKPLQEGRLDLEINISSKNELGRLAETIKQSMGRVEEYVGDISRVMGELAQGNFDVHTSTQYIGDFQSIETALDVFTNAVSDAMGNIVQAERRVSDHAEQLSSGAQALAQGATEQASAVEELYATVDDLSKSASRNVEAAANAQRNAKLTSEQVSLSSQQMEQMVSAMEDISDASQQIGKIISTIEDIAFQTNILALNAAVEAARAGSAGKGFAVVADEVRNLASKSDEAAKATKELIEDSIASVHEGGQVVRRVTESLDNTSAIAGNVTIKVNSVVESVEGQTAAISQVTEGINQISSVVQITSGATEQSAATAQELSDQSRLMNELVRRFCLE